jgi:16S rRNA (cytosine1402-N4)-methyltransferase
MKKKENNKTPSGNPVAESGGAGYHTSVLLHECTMALAIQPNAVYVDATFGGGGHSQAILDKLGPDGKLFAFDQDEDAAKNAPADERFKLIRANFREMKRFLRMYEAIPVDGILADIGVSSWQIDSAGRGFSYRFEGPLDMRMNRDAGKTAAEVLNEYSAEELQLVLGQYGEVRNAKTLALAMVEARKVKQFKWISDLKAVCEANRIGEATKYLSQVFQAIRIEVNDELGALKDFLQQSAEVLKPGGRLAVITFHSLEDRLVKNYMKHGAFSDEPVKDFFGKADLKFRPVNKKPIEAGAEELKKNMRSRSAKLRVAERI